MIRTRQTRWLVALGLSGLAVGCREHETRDRSVTAPPPAGEHVQIHVTAAGASPTQVESQILQPLEHGLHDLPGLRHISAEAREGHARIDLEVLELGDARTQIAARIRALADSLPASAGVPSLVLGAGPATKTLRWFIHSESLDPLTMARLHASLVTRVEALHGVRRVDGCAQRRRVIVELDPQRLAARGLDASAVAESLRASMVDLPGFDDAERGVAAMRGLTIPSPRSESSEPAGASIALAELAAIRYGFGEPTCVAASAGGLVASASVLVDGPEALTALISALDDAARELPPEVQLRRFDPDDTLLALALPASTSLEDAAELIGGGFSRDRPNWLVEVGREPDEPCAGSGLRVHLSVPGSPAQNAGLVESLHAIPGVRAVEIVGAPSAQRRLWLLGPDREALARFARELEAQHPALTAYVDEPGPELKLSLDREALARHGLSAGAVQRQLELARGLTIGALFEDDGTPLPLVVRILDLDGSDPDSLQQLHLDASAGSLPLSAVARIELVEGVRRLCRRDGRGAIMLALDAPDPGAEERLVATLQTDLPPDGAWAWDRD